MLSLVEGDLAVAEELLDRAHAVHATPAVRVLRRLVTEQQLVDEEAEDDPQYYAEGAG
ncbi:MAG TPA: hypothetical protein VNW90_02320 [Acetobacteraceae bacterium]|nr:hypothetical protein [Acetobacteraceae bacterium]